MPLIALDGGQGESGGQVLRAALALSAATGQGFAMSRIRERRPRPGLLPQHVAAVRAAALVCGAQVHGAFDGSPDLRFEPGAVAGGEFRFELTGGEPVAPVVQMVAPALARAAQPGRVVVTGGTHVPVAPSLEYLSRHWAAAVEPLGIRCACRLERAGFHPRGGGEARAQIAGGAASADALRLEDRGALLEVRGLSGAGKLKGDVARRQAEGATRRLWEERRLEAKWDVVDVKANSPGSFLLLEAVFERGRGAFGFLGERRLRPEALGERAARRLLRFLEEEGAVDPLLADQLVVPLALARGGRITTPAVSPHLETVTAVLPAFGVSARTWGRRGGPGGVEVGG